VLQLARGKRAAQDKHFEFSTLPKTQKVTEIQNFENKNSKF